MVRRMIEDIDALSADVRVWVLDYPPYDGLNETGRNLLPDAVAYEAWRADYADAMRSDPRARFVGGVYRDWRSSDRYHPLLAGGDFHLDERSAYLAALRIYQSLLDAMRADH